MNRDFKDLKEKVLDTYTQKKDIVNRDCKEFEFVCCGNLGVDGMMM